MEIYDINQLQAMCLADFAWHEVNTTTIQNCWHKGGILPDVHALPSSSQYKPLIPISSLLHDSSSEMDPIAHAERQVGLALNDLEETSALQKSN